jgi:hypothetical protein
MSIKLEVHTVSEKMETNSGTLYKQITNKRIKYSIPKSSYDNFLNVRLGKWPSFEDLSTILIAVDEADVPFFSTTNAVKYLEPTSIFCAYSTNHDSVDEDCNYKNTTKKSSSVHLVQGKAFLLMRLPKTYVLPNLPVAYKPSFIPNTPTVTLLPN